ncbi:MAG: 2-hydroxyacid dehydrogenase [Chloroflexi bacterium]|nr:2-hydroxyacid dehydrogenase [Chloroflexota bacterium]
MADAKVVFLHGLPERVVEVITSFTPPGFATQLVDRKQPDEEHMEAVKDADFLIVYRGRLTDDMLRAAREARLVQLLAAGYDSMNLKLMRDLEMPCANNGGANSWAVADHAVMLMLAIYKQLIPAYNSTREGRWSAPITGMNTFELANKLVGIIGIGNIGRQVARRVQAFDAKAQYYDKFPLPPERNRQLGVTPVSLDELFRTSDIVTCHTPLTRETRHIVSRERLATMKPTAILINTSRGPVVDEQALIGALREKKIAAAGLDVFEKEPVDPNNPLLKMDNVVVTPHSAGTTWDTWYRRAEFAYSNIKRVWEGEAPLAIAQDYDIED